MLATKKKLMFTDRPSRNALRSLGLLASAGNVTGSRLISKFQSYAIAVGSAKENPAAARLVLVTIGEVENVDETLIFPKTCVMLRKH